MKASFYTGNQTFEVRDVTPAEPGEGEVRVRVAYCGICGTESRSGRSTGAATVRPAAPDTATSA